MRSWVHDVAVGHQPTTNGMFLWFRFAQELLQSHLTRLACCSTPALRFEEDEHLVQATSY